jgi:hypothetical protein
MTVSLVVPFLIGLHVQACLYKQLLNGVCIEINNINTVFHDEEEGPRFQTKSAPITYPAWGVSFMQSITTVNRLRLKIKHC